MALNMPLLEQSFELVAPTEAAKQACVNECYATLLRLHPKVEQLFAHTNIEEQARKLMATLTLVLHALKKPGVFMSTLQRLGRCRKAGWSAGRALSDSNRGASCYVRLLVRVSMDNGDAGRLDRGL